MTLTPSAPAGRDEAERSARPQMCCGRCSAVHASSFFCPACGAIQLLPPQVDYFQLLGIEPRLVVDVQKLEQRYFELSRRLHPDRYQSSPTPARIASLSNTAALNRAYRTLRDPVERGLYWLGLQGERLGAGNNRVPPEMAALVFEVQEKLDELRGSDGARGRLAAEVTEISAHLQQRRAELLAQLAGNFTRWDAGATDAGTLTQELKAILSALAYLRTLLRDVDKALET